MRTRHHVKCTIGGEGNVLQWEQIIFTINQKSHLYCVSRCPLPSRVDVRVEDEDIPIPYMVMTFFYSFLLLSCYMVYTNTSTVLSWKPTYMVILRR